MASDGQAILRDGRTLGYAEFGTPDGEPLFYFHGFPGSRLEAELAHAAALRLGVRVIALDRPGYGLSGFKPNRTILDWPDDVVEVADDFVGFDRFMVMGASGGGPYAAVCARMIPERLSAAEIVCGLGPIDVHGVPDRMVWQNRFGLRLYRAVPWLGALIFGLGFRMIRRNPEWFFRRMARSLGEPDRSVLQQPHVEPIFLNAAGEACRSHPQGPARDLALYTSPWGFLLGDISFPVHLWQGECDVIVPPSMARNQGEAIPNSTVTFVPGEGHFSLIVNHVAEILQVLCSESSHKER